MRVKHDGELSDEGGVCYEMPNTQVEMMYINFTKGIPGFDYFDDVTKHALKTTYLSGIVDYITLMEDIVKNGACLKCIRDASVKFRTLLEEAVDKL